MLLLFISTLLFFFVTYYWHTIENNDSSIPTKVPINTPTITQPASASQANRLSDAILTPQDVDPLLIKTVQHTFKHQQPYNIPSMPLRLNDKKIQKKAIPKRNILEKKLAKFNSLHRSIILHEILLPFNRLH